MTKRIVLLKPGVTSSRAVLGDYEVWFQRTCGDVELTPVELHAGEKPPDVSAFDGAIMTGSPLSVTQPLDWMHEAAEWLVRAEKPVLGVCFGHQLLAWRHGGRVMRNPLGRELGTVTVELTDEGRASPLFSGVEVRFEVQATHEDVVAEVPPSVRVLAKNAFGLQALQFSDRCFGVQFHPEMDAASIRYCIASKDTRPEDREKAEARETPWGERVLRQFVAMC
jgi:GMP synthase (glutamine-hydrolysing)